MLPISPVRIAERLEHIDEIVVFRCGIDAGDLPKRWLEETDIREAYAGQEPPGKS